MDQATQARRSAFAALSVATESELDAALKTIMPLPAIENLRSPEIGTVMLRGRMGGNGQPFNVGEAAVTRAAKPLPTRAQPLVGVCLALSSP